MSGKIVVYTGPMFSGKSGMLLVAYEKAMISGKSVVSIKPKSDDRFGKSVIKSRSFGEIEANNISDISELLNYDADIYIIDEFQFLDGDVSIIQFLANKGKVFHIAGLDMTAEGKPFARMAEICAIANQVIKNVAVCNECKHENAIYSFFLGIKTKDILIGDKEYIALCRSCWQKKMEDKKRGLI